MTVRREGDRVILDGVCGLSEAETLVGWLQTGASEVDLGSATSIHAAVLQALLALRPETAALPEDPVLRELLSSCGLGSGGRD